MASPQARLATGAVGRHLVDMTVPVLFGIFTMMLQGFVDAWFIGRVGDRRTVGLRCRKHIVSRGFHASSENCDRNISRGCGQRGALRRAAVEEVARRVAPGGDQVWPVGGEVALLGGVEREVVELLPRFVVDPRLWPVGIMDPPAAGLESGGELVEGVEVDQLLFLKVPQQPTTHPRG